MRKLLLLVISVSAAWFASSSFGDATERVPSSSECAKRAPSTPRLFCPSSFWNAKLRVHAPIDRRSAELSGALRREAKLEISEQTGPWISTRNYTTPLYTVPADQPTVHVELEDGHLAWKRSLQKAFRAVPIPPEAVPDPGTDGHLTIWQPSTDRLWEFWRASEDVLGNWHARWGGAMENVSESPGYFTSDSWPGATAGWGATATSLPVIGGTILLEELERGRIDHALALNIPATRAEVFSWPAQRTDGFIYSRDAIPEGARFRLDPTVDLDRFEMSPLIRMMADAVKRYGMVVRDRTGAGGAISFKVENTRRYGPDADPFWTPDGKPRADGYLGGKWPASLFKAFPWRHLQLLKMRLCDSPPSGPCSWPR